MRQLLIFYVGQHGTIRIDPPVNVSEDLPHADIENFVYVLLEQRLGIEKLWPEGRWIMRTRPHATRSWVTMVFVARAEVGVPVFDDLTPHASNPLVGVAQ